MWQINRYMNSKTLAALSTDLRKPKFSDRITLERTVTVLKLYVERKLKIPMFTIGEMPTF